jgi:hypothetical protein
MHTRLQWHSCGRRCGLSVSIAEQMMRRRVQGIRGTSPLGPAMVHTAACAGGTHGTVPHNTTYDAFGRNCQ